VTGLPIVPRSEVERQKSVHNILQNFRGIDPLKKLFWSELNYDRINNPLSRMESPLRALRLFQCQTGSLAFSQRQTHDDDIKRRRLFRRITVGPEERLRTASERLEKINLTDIRREAPITIQQLHDDAFDVEPVTKEFFHEYGRIFEQVERAVKGVRDKGRKRLFTQRLFNRIMFIAFIQKKGWLTLDGDTDYLSALWGAYQRDKSDPTKNCYRDRFKPLFFYGLNSSNEINQVSINRGGYLKIRIGEVPYLNGGLFEEDEDDRDEQIVVPDNALDAVLNDLFARFNFTVTESTPLDVEVAVDPEMLGKVFEELVTGRHETGSYYTPKPIVAFMCREAIKGHLRSQLPDETSESIEEFVDAHNADNLRNAEAVLEALRSIKVCDPACGSGAYLVGMLHELLDLRVGLFATKKLDAKSAYDRKLDIIQSNLYGVDIDLFAVNIARLRLWLSLSVEYDGINPPPLPNLDYKVEVGDTVCSPNPSGFQLGLQKALVDDFLAAKADYMSAHDSRKLELRKTISELRRNIATWAHRDGNDFDWPIEFAEVFVGGGFDVVLANPPYVRMELFKDIKPSLRRNFPHIHADRADLYCYFYARSLEILHNGGMLAFISSKKWFRARYGAKLRKYVADTCRIASITDFGDLPVFEGATAYPMIFIAQKASAGDVGPVFTEVRSLGPPYPDVRALIRSQGQTLPHSAVSGGDWTLTCQAEAEFLGHVRGEGASLMQFTKGHIFYGVKTGLNDAFVINGQQRQELLAQNSASARVIKPLITGKDIRRWKAKKADRWLIYIPHDASVRDLPAVVKHLKPYKTDLEGRATKQAWYELQQPQARYAAYFDQPKIVYPIITNEPRFALDKTGSYISDKVYAILSDDLYLLGVLNSSSMWRVITSLCSPLRGGFYELRVTQIGTVPIPDAPAQERSKISQLVEKCINVDATERDGTESEIDDRVAKLYGV